MYQSVGYELTFSSNSTSVYTYQLLYHYAIVNDPSEEWFRFLLEDWISLVKEWVTDCLPSLGKMTEKLKTFWRMLETFTYGGRVKDVMKQFCEWFIPLFLAEQRRQQKDYSIDQHVPIYRRGFFYNFACYFHLYASKPLGDQFFELFNTMCSGQCTKDQWIPYVYMKKFDSGIEQMEIGYVSQ
jgi:hypothetical protein